MPDPSETFTKVAVTGHRPNAIPEATRPWVQAEVARVLHRLHDEHGTEIALSGLALGVDTWFAKAALATGLRLWAYVPFEAQADRWTSADQETWRQLRAHAEHEIVLGEGYDVRLLHARNDRLIADCDLLICVHDPTVTTGGTASTVTKATAAGTPLVRIDLAARRTTFVRATTRPGADMLPG